MSDPFNIDEEWVEIRDDEGRPAAMRHLATIQFKGVMYHLLCAVHENEEAEEESGFLLIREENAADGTKQFVITQDEEEITRVIGGFVLHAMFERISGEEFEEQESPCGHRHAPWEFCVCGDPDYIQ